MCWEREREREEQERRDLRAEEAARKKAALNWLRSLKGHLTEEGGRQESRRAEANSGEEATQRGIEGRLRLSQESVTKEREIGR